MHTLGRGLPGYLFTGTSYKKLYYKMKRFITTGSKELDRLLDYGIESGMKYLFYGEAGTGKTFLLHQIIANTYKNDDYIDSKLIYIDLEGNFSTSLLTSLSDEKILRRVFVVRYREPDKIIEIMKRLLFGNDKIGIIVVDNISGVTNLEEKEPSISYIYMKQIMYVLNLIKEKYFIPIVITARVYSKPHVYSTDYIRPRGGLSLLSMVNKIVYLSKREQNIFHAIDEYSDMPAAFFKISDKGIEDV